MRIIAILLLIFFSLLLRYLFRIWKNWRIAKRLNLPIVISPFNQHGPFWQLFQRQLLPLFSFLPESLAAFTRVTWAGWEYADKGRIHQQLGSAFVIVNPTRNEIVLSEPDSIHDVLTKPKEFRKPPKFYEFLGIFGPSILTTNDKVWTHHRRVTAPCFNERVSQTVWKAASQQAQSMLEQIVNSGTGRIYTNLCKDTRVIALHVLMEAGLDISQPFSRGVREPEPGHTMSFGDALFHLVGNVVAASILSSLVKPWLLSFLPEILRRMHLATNECRTYFSEMIREQRTRVRALDKTHNNLLGALVKASDEADQEKNQGYGSGGLTIDEIRGNIYAFTVAGHETNANVLAYAICLLAAYPKWQDWIAEEARMVLKNHDKTDYGIFPRLKRCQALLYETVRLYGPVPWIPRETTSKTEAISLGNGKSITVPPNTDLHLNMYTGQVSTEIWGSDALQFRPDRFIVPPNKPVLRGWIEQGSAADGEEKLVAPPLSNFSPWALGPRVCPGMRFSQVEFAAVISTLFSQVLVYPAVSRTKGIGNPEGAHDRYQQLRNTIEDSAFLGIGLSIARPEDVHLEWKMQK